MLFSLKDVPQAEVGPPVAGEVGIMDVERDRSDGAVVGILQPGAPEAVAGGVVVDGDQRAQVGGGTHIVAEDGEVVLPEHTVSEIDPDDAGL